MNALAERKLGKVKMIKDFAIHARVVKHLAIENRSLQVLHGNG